MISSHALFTVYELYFLNNQQFGFYMTNAAPRSYVQIQKSSAKICHATGLKPGAGMVPQVKGLGMVSDPALSHLL